MKFFNYDGTMYAKNPNEVYSNNAWEFKFGSFARVKLLPLSELSVPSILEQNCGWVLIRDSDGIVIGIETHVPCNPLRIVTFDFVTKYFEDGFRIVDEDLNVNRNYQMTRALTESEIDFAKAKFIELLQAEQDALLEQREAVRFMKKSEANYD